MKPLKHVLSAMVLVFLAGCTTTFRPWNLSEIEEGMSRAQVVDILGEPDYREMDNEAEVLHYIYMENYNPPLTDDSTRDNAAGRGLWERQMEQGFKEYRYAVTLIDGKVQSYKELTD